ncbi:lysyl oxidase-like 2 isoform X2 [Lycorma delicatula]|uniref:lysyl oxidase-like 2 isoform X2 n=1 Tax=Lycorma delicatula TaxID=130591 RepID=UPI003F513C11
MVSWQKLMIVLLFFHMGDADGGSRSQVHWQKYNAKKYLKKHYKHEGSLQLVDGKKHNEGNVEIFHLGRWGSICDDEFDEREADVVCRQLGFPRAIKHTLNSHFGPARNWGVICGDGWSLLEASVVCRQLGFGYANAAIQTDFFGGNRSKMLLSGVQCRGNEASLEHCLYDQTYNVQCPGTRENIASVVCSPVMADLVIDHYEIQRSAHLEDKQLYYLQCAMEENCLASAAYQLQRENHYNWHLQPRRLLRFTAMIHNTGTADFRSAVPKHLWQFHQCHMHYHSMEVFATFDVLDKYGRKVAEGHKASFCLEDNQCLPGVRPVYACANYGDQGISVNCTDIYRYNIDCQWVDISELKPGIYTFKVSINPEFKVPEMTFDNNAAVCNMYYTQSSVSINDCTIQRP